MMAAMTYASLRLALPPAALLGLPIVGEGCSVGSECCGGDCRPPAGGGAPVCSPPPPERCRNEGETCNDTADCCAGMDLTCSLNVCTAGPG